MSLYSFAAANFTTIDDRKRRPAVDPGQILRTFILFILFVFALAALAQRAPAAQLDQEHVETVTGHL